MQSAQINTASVATNSGVTIKEAPTSDVLILSPRKRNVFYTKSFIPEWHNMKTKVYRSGSRTSVKNQNRRKSTNSIYFLSKYIFPPTSHLIRLKPSYFKFEEPLFFRPSIRCLNFLGRGPYPLDFPFPYILFITIEDQKNDFLFEY